MKTNHFLRVIGFAFLFLLIMLLSAREGMAQYNTAEISGTVTDSQGAAIPGASVTAVHSASGTVVERVTNAEGRFFLPSLNVGDYRVIISSKGFKQSIQQHLNLQVGQKLDFPVTLTVGDATESVTVTADVGLLRTEDAQVSDTIDNQKVKELPLNGRQFLQLAQLSDGVVIPPGGTRGAALEQAGALPAVLGQRSGHNIYLLDGVKVTDEYFNNLVISPSIDGIQEFKIQKTMYPAEFGGKASALINVVSKSGTNAFHGSVFEFFRNDKLDARNYFDDGSKPTPPLRQNQFGVNLGGPIRKEQTFFFFSYEGARIHRTLTQTFSVPTDALRGGDFSGLPALCDPLTKTSSSCAGFTGNQIPADRLDPVALAILAKVPKANGSGAVQNLVAAEPQDNPMDQYSLRIDHRLSANDNVFGRFTAYDVKDSQPFGTSSLNEALVPGFGRVVNTRSRNLAFSHIHTFSPRLLNEFRLGYLMASGGQTSPNQGVSLAAAGLQGVTTNPEDMGYPQVSFGGLFSVIGDPTVFVTRNNRSFEFYDNVLWDRGAHHLKFGAYLFRLEFNPVNPQAARGAFTFNGQFSGNAFADFLLGYPGSAQVGIGRADEHGRSTWFHVYGQDDWKVRSNLTINAGLRYEINGQMNDIDNRLSTVDLTVPGGRFVIASDDNGNISPTAASLLPEIPIPYTTSDEAGWTSALLRPSYLRFAPRLGVVWSPDSRTVVNGGFGVFLNQWAYSVQQSLAQTVPFFFAKTVNAASDAINPPFQTATVLTAPANGTIGGNTMLHDFRTEYANNISFGIQRQLTRTTSVEANYLGSWVVGADSSTVINVPEPGPGAIGPRRPVPQLANLTAIRWDGYSIFHGLTFKVDQRLSHGLTVSANYMLSKAIDDASDPGATSYETNLPQNVRDMGSERATASFDHRHRFVASAGYELPSQLKIGKNWRLSGIVTLQSGAPFTVIIGTDRANIGSGPAQRPNVTCDPNDGGAKTSAQWFNTACFTLQDNFTFGNSGRNTVLAPEFTNVDASVQKDIRISERSRMEFRLEVFNLLNNVNFDVPNRTAFTSNFGRIFSAGPSRQTQLALKLHF